MNSKVDNVTFVVFSYQPVGVSSASIRQNVRNSEVQGEHPAQQKVFVDLTESCNTTD